MSLGSWWNKHVTQPLKKIAPYIALAVAIFAPGFASRIGFSLGATTEAGAAAAGSAALAGGTSLVAGATPEQAARSAVLAGIGSGAGSTVQQATGLSGVTGAAASGAASGATQAALTGQDVGKAALKGGATAGLSAGLQQGYQSLLPAEKIDYSLNQPSGTGLKGSTDLASVDPKTGQADYSFTPANKTTANIGQTDPTQGAIDYSFTPSGNEASGIQTTDISSDKSVFSPTKLSSSDKAIADYIAKYTVNKLSPASKSLTSQTSDVATGSQASPQAAGAADVAMLDTTSPEGISGKAGKKGGKYPWGDPEGTTALKQEGQVI